MQEIKYQNALYRGDIVDGVPNGNGTMFFYNGNKYEGEFIDGRCEGLGNLKLRDGTIVTGCFYNGVAQGAGVIFYADGDVLWGTIENNKSRKGFMFNCNTFIMKKYDSNSGYGFDEEPVKLSKDTAKDMVYAYTCISKREREANLPPLKQPIIINVVETQESSYTNRDFTLPRDRIIQKRVTQNKTNNISYNTDYQTVSNSEQSQPNRSCNNESKAQDFYQSASDYDRGNFEDAIKNYDRARMETLDNSMKIKCENDIRFCEEKIEEQKRSQALDLYKDADFYYERGDYKYAMWKYQEALKLSDNYEFERDCEKLIKECEENL